MENEKLTDYPSLMDIIHQARETDFIAKSISNVNNYFRLNLIDNRALTFFFFLMNKSRARDKKPLKCGALWDIMRYSFIVIFIYCQVLLL